MIGEAVSVALKDAAYAVDWVQDGATANNALENGEHQAVLLDLGLPRRDGVEVLRRLRQSGNTVPVIVITARDAMEDRIKGLDAGADDYLVKPFDVNELLARLRAVIHRQGGQAASVLSNGVVSLDPATRMARRENAAHPLSAREFALLHALLLRPGAILTRDELEERIFGWNEEVESNAVDFLIHGVRKKLRRRPHQERARCRLDAGQCKETGKMRPYRLVVILMALGLTGCASYAPKPPAQAGGFAPVRCVHCPRSCPFAVSDPFYARVQPGRRSGHG